MKSRKKIDQMSIQIDIDSDDIQTTMDSLMIDALNQDRVPAALVDYIRGAVRECLEGRAAEGWRLTCSPPSLPSSNEEEARKVPKHDVESGHKFEQSMSLQEQTRYDPLLAQLVRSVCTDIGQEELNVNMAFMSQDTVVSISQDPRTTEESRLAAAFVLRYGRSYLVDRYARPFLAGKSFCLDDGKIDEDDRGCGDAFEKRLLYLITCRWRKLHHEACSAAWQVALEDKGERNTRRAADVHRHGGTPRHRLCRTNEPRVGGHCQRQVREHAA